MNENERIVCEFLRKIAPSREWEYLGEVEHYLIDELCDELNKQLKAENAKLRELLQRSITTHDKMCTQRKNCFGCRFFGDFVCEPIKVSKEAEKLGIEVE